MADKAANIVEIRDLSFRYPSRTDPSLNGVNLSLTRGEAVLVTGPTGCGKTTLLKTLNGTIPLESSGEMRGRVLIDGHDTRTCRLSGLSQLVGFVFQSPEDQICCTNVRDEVAFGPENLDLSEPEVDARVREALNVVGLGEFLSAQTAKLSGGQIQRIAIASQLAMKPKVLALDEPISQLDPRGASEVVASLKNLRDAGISIVIVEHRIADVMELVDRVVLMDGGGILLDFPKNRLAEHVAVFETLGIQVPDIVKIKSRLGWEFPFAVSGAGSESAVGKAADLERPALPKDFRKGVCHDRRRPPLIKLEDVEFTFPGAKSPALLDISLEIARGETVAVMGANGSGKSTLLSILSGLNRPGKGRVLYLGRVTAFDVSPGRGVNTGLLFQNPDLQLLEDTVAKELTSGPRHLKLSREDANARAEEIAALFDLASFLETPPWALSKGQRLRVALGALLTMRPDVLLLDEPTTGQNERSIQRLLEVLRERFTLDAIVFCSHDILTVARYADHLVLMSEGRIIADGPVFDIMCRCDLLRRASVSPLLPVELSLSLGLLPPALTAEEFIDRFPHAPPASRAAGLD